MNGRSTNKISDSFEAYIELLKDGDYDDYSQFFQEIFVETDRNIENIDHDPNREKWEMNLKLHGIMTFDPILLNDHFISRFQCVYEDRSVDPQEPLYSDKLDVRFDLYDLYGFKTLNSELFPILSEYFPLEKIEGIELRNLTIRESISEDWLEPVRNTLKHVHIFSCDLPNLSSEMFRNTNLLSVGLIGNRIAINTLNENGPILNLSDDKIDFTFSHNVDQNRNELSWYS